MGSPAIAAPDRDDFAHAAAQNVDYLSAETASSLALSFSVLVPPFVPAPFGGEPAVSAGGGYYSLYWMIGGGDPTLLQVTGEAGGALPAGSPYDLNNELFVNASVQGYEAIHDVTPIYDIVWWIAGGVLYKVESRNMQGTDSLSLANALVPLIPPAAPEAPIVDPESEVPEVPEVPTDGGDADPGPIEENVEAPSVDDTDPEEPTTDDDAPSESSEPEPEEDSTEVQADPATEDEPTTVEPEGEADPAVDDDPDVPSDLPPGDGTGGPPAPVPGSDGTGGTNELVIPPDGQEETP